MKNHRDWTHKTIEAEEMFLHGVQDVEFIGGPFDGLRKIRPPSDGWREVIAVLVNENVLSMVAGMPRVSKSPARSVAVYKLREHKGEYRYHFMGAKLPKEFDVENQRI